MSSDLDEARRHFPEQRFHGCRLIAVTLPAAPYLRYSGLESPDELAEFTDARRVMRRFLSSPCRAGFSQKVSGVGRGHRHGELITHHRGSEGVRLAGHLELLCGWVRVSRGRSGGGVRGCSVAPAATAECAGHSP